MSDTEITWAGLTLGGDGPYIVDKVEGWDELPDIGSLDSPRVRGHGDHVGGQFGRSRIVTVEGKVADLEARDTLVRALQAATVVSSVVEDLSVDMFGQRLTAGARVARRAVTTGLNYSVGEVPFALQWRCPDPLRYGDAVTATTGLPTAGGGLAYPLAYPLDYGQPGNPGQLTLPNAGTADTPVRFDVTGPLPAGFELSSAAGRLVYPLAVPAGQTVTIDTATGSVVVEGTADRRMYLTYTDWMQVPAGGSLMVQFTSLSTDYDPAATVTATVREAHW